MITVLSWNLNGLDEHRLDERIEAACLSLLLRPQPPMVVLFQEIVDRALNAHLRPHFSHAGYAAAIQPASGEYYVGAFVRRPMRLTGAELHLFADSPHGRGLLELTAEHEGRSWRLSTAHFESGQNMEPSRRTQLLLALQRLAEHEGPALFAGDTNLRAAEAGELPAQHQVADAWEAAGKPQGAQGTWQPPRGGTGHARWARFDRAYVNERVEVERFATFSVQTDLDPVPVSDHRAIELTVRAR